MINKDLRIMKLYEIEFSSISSPSLCLVFKATSLTMSYQKLRKRVRRNISLTGSSELSLDDFLEEGILWGRYRSLLVL